MLENGPNPLVATIICLAANKESFGQGITSNI
jgi:hypothetical protein